MGASARYNQPVRYKINPELRRNPAKLERFTLAAQADHAKRCRLCGGARRFSFIAGGYICATPCSMLTGKIGFA
jgi:hypothetical protein